MQALRRGSATVVVVAGMAGVTVIGAGGAGAAGQAQRTSTVQRVESGNGFGRVPGAAVVNGAIRLPSFTFSVISPVNAPPGTQWARFDAVATGINDAGAVVGNAEAHGDYRSRAFVSRYSGRGTWLPSGGRAAEAAAVSRTGWVVGSVVKAGTTFDQRPVRWSPAGRMYALPVQNQQPWHILAVKVNSSGTILGWINNWINDGFWTSWTVGGAGGSFAAQEYRLGLVNLAPSDISDAGTIVGSITAKVFAPASRGSLAAVLAPGQPRVFPELSASTESRATAISPNQRYIVGSVWQKGSFPQRVGVYYRWWNTPVKLGYSAFDPTDVNDAAVIVGTKLTGSTTTAMWLGFNQARTLAAMTRNLPSGWRLTEAVALNARGDVAVTAVAPSGRTFAARLRVS